SDAYHIPFGMRLRGDLNRAALKRALDRIMERHQALRTTFVNIDGEPVQRIHAAGSGFPLVEHDLTQHRSLPDEVDRLVQLEARSVFDLGIGPLIRGRLIRESEDGHVLLITMHHIVADGWSLSVLMEELSALYGAFVSGKNDPLPELPVQYADYAVWQR